MQFTAPVSIDKAIRILSSHQQEIPVLADTVVEITKPNFRGEGGFSVKRRWKAKRGWGTYIVVELNGTLVATSDEQTLVNARIQFGIMAYVSLALLVLLLLAGATSLDSGIYWVASIVVAVLFVLDAYVLYRVISSLKTGDR